MRTTINICSGLLGLALLENLSRSSPGPDSAFSIETPELTALVEAVRHDEKSLGPMHYGVSADEPKSHVFPQWLFGVRNMKAGEVFTGEQVGST